MFDNTSEKHSWDVASSFESLTTALELLRCIGVGDVALKFARYTGMVQAVTGALSSQPRKRDYKEK